MKSAKSFVVLVCGIVLVTVAIAMSPPDASGRIHILTFNDLNLRLNSKVHSPEHVEQIPNALTELDGKFVTIKGFMLPTFQDAGLTQFTLVEKRRL